MRRENTSAQLTDSYSLFRNSVAVASWAAMSRVFHTLIELLDTQLTKTFLSGFVAGLKGVSSFRNDCVSRARRVCNTQSIAAQLATATMLRIKLFEFVARFLGAERIWD